MRYLLLAAVLPVTASAQILGGAQARPITLAEAITLAQRNSPQTIAARNAIRQTDVAVRTALAQFLPSINASMGASHSGGKELLLGELVPRRGVPWSFSRGLNAQLELFDAGRRLYTVQAARANAFAAEEDERAQRFQTALSVSQQYYAALAARESRGAAQSQLQEAEQNLRSAVARLTAGAATRSDSLRSVIQVGNARLAMLTAETNLENANAQLTRLVGTSFVVTASEADTGRVEAFLVDTAQLATFASRAPQVLAAEASVNAARADLRAARTPYFPTLSMSAGLSGNNTSRDFDWGQGLTSQSRSISFSLSFPVFNRLNREQTVIQRAIAETNALASLRDAKLLLEQQLVQYTGQLRLAQTRILIQQASVEAAQEDLRVQQQRYQLGASTQLELLTTQNALNQARFQLINARYDVRIARAQIEALLGREIR
jgi:outer membrane protein